MILWKREAYVESVSILVGAVIGAGILGLPSRLKESGLVPYILLAVIAFWIYYLTSLATKRLMQHFKNVDRVYLGELVELGFGKTGKRVVVLSLLLFFVPTLGAYFTAYSSLFAHVGLSNIYGVVVLFLLCTFPVITGLKSTGRLESVITFMMVTVILLLIVLLLPNGNVEKVPLFWSADNEMRNLLTSFLVILFAMDAHMVIPEAYKLLRHEHLERNFRSVIVLGFGIPALIYLLFSLAVVASMPEVNEIAPTSFSSGVLQVLGVSFAFFAVATSAIAVTLAACDMMESDLKLRRESAILLLLVSVFMGLGNFSFTQLLAIAACYGVLIPIGFILFTLMRVEKLKVMEKILYALCMAVILFAMVAETCTLLL